MTSSSPLRASVIVISDVISDVISVSSFIVTVLDALLAAGVVTDSNNDDDDDEG